MPIQNTVIIYINQFPPSSITKEIPFPQEGIARLLFCGMFLRDGKGTVLTPINNLISANLISIFSPTKRCAITQFVRSVDDGFLCLLKQGKSDLFVLVFVPEKMSEYDSCNAANTGLTVSQ
jgi:hypothetical protein